MMFYISMKNNYREVFRTIYKVIKSRYFLLAFLFLNFSYFFLGSISKDLFLGPQIIKRSLSFKYEILNCFPRYIYSYMYNSYIYIIVIQ